MELKKAGDWLKKVLQKENALRLVVVLGICGIALLALSSFDFGGPEPREEPEREESNAGYARALEQDLSRIVTAITGEHDPAVMVTLENTGSRVFAADEKESSEERESAHVVLEDSQGAQSPLTVTQVQPAIQGVVIVSARAKDPAVKEKLTNAAMTALGIPSSRVCVTCGD